MAPIYLGTGVGGVTGFRGVGGFSGVGGGLVFSSSPILK
jgi:hypothetical protein